MTKFKLETLRDVHKALSAGRDHIAAMAIAKARLNAGDGQLGYAGSWEQSFDVAANALVDGLEKELIDVWNNNPSLDTPLSPKTQEALRAIHELLRKK